MNHETQDQSEELLDELRNFEEIARFLSPSPGEIPRLEGIDIHGLSMPLRRVIGGDHILYIDFRQRYDLARRVAEATQKGQTAVADKLRELEGRAGILVADVSGHRMTDAMVAAMAHQAFLLGVNYELDMFGEVTTRIFEHINTRIYRTTATNKFFTMIYGEITTEGKFRFISAGHEPPVVFSREFRRFMPISSDQLVSFPPVGLLPSAVDPDHRQYPSRLASKKRYEINEIDLLAVGDILLLYTDGLREHAGGALFDQALEPLLGEMREESSERICARLREEIPTHGQQQDDISFVIIRKTA